MTADDHDPYDYESLFADADAPEPKLYQRVSKRTAIRSGIIAFVVLALLTTILYARHQTNPGGRYGEVNVEVPKGASFSDVAQLLDDKNVVPSALFLKIYAKISGAPNVQAGEYAFAFRSSDSDALATLKAGPKPLTDRLVIPEGLRLRQIAERVGQLPGKSAVKFYELATNGSVRSDYSPYGSKDLEGLLYPDTYLLSSSDTELTLLQRMVHEFDNEAKVLNIDSSISSVGHTPYETLVIASMIEAEAKVPQDRGKISQVIENRLFKAMPIQIDATVLYALGNRKQALSLADLKVDSPYNTYAHMGLPPGPICSPGAASLQAALAPTPGPWLYYVVTGADGSHSFATTLTEQNANIALAKSKGLR